MARQTVLVALVLTTGCLGSDSAGDHPISEGGQGAYEASLASSDDGFVVGWHDTRNASPEIYARALDADGRPVGPEWRITEDPHLSYEPDVVTVAGGFAVAWYEVTDTGSRVRVGSRDENGVPRWEKTVSATGGRARNPVLAWSGRELFIAWLEHDGQRWAVWGRWLDPEGTPRGDPMQIGLAAETTWNLNVALDNRGEPWVVFDAPVGGATEELFAARVSGDGVYLTQLTCDDGAASKYPDIAFGPARVAVTWFDQKDGNREVYLASLPREELSDGIKQRARRVTRTPGESIGAYLAWNGQQIGLAWSDDTEGSHEIYFQRFAMNGNPLQQPLRLTNNPTASLIPSIQPFADGFAIAWNEDVVEQRGSHAAGGRSEVLFGKVP